MAAIGTMTVLAMRGDLVPPQRRTSAGDRRGVDGAEYLDEGLKEIDSVVETVTFVSDASAASAAVEAAAALTGTIVTVTDGNGVSHTGVLVVDFQHAITACTVTTAGAYTRRVAFRWTLRKLVDRYTAPA